MSQELAAVYEELVRLKDAGLERVSIDPKTLDQLKSAADNGNLDLSLLESLTASSNSAKSAATAAEAPAPKNNRATDSSSVTSDPAIQAPVPPKPVAKQSPPAKTLPDAPKVSLSSGEPKDRMEALEAMVANCATCLKESASDEKLVFGTGALDAQVFFCGEAPGKEEAQSGTPFVGEGGQLLGKILKAMELSQESVYLSNVLKWRPQHDKPYGNRPPNADEIRFCLPYLLAQIEIIQPKVIVALGNVAASALLGNDPQSKVRLGDIRGQWHQVGETDLMVTYHPNYLLRNGTMKTKRTFWEDMLKVLKRIDQPITEKQERYFLTKS